MKKYTKKNPDGNVYMEKQMFSTLKKEQTVICYNEEEGKSHLLEFFCCVCNRHSKGLKAGESHWQNQKHKKTLFGHTSKVKHVENLPELSTKEDLDLSELLEKTAVERLMSEENFEERLNVCREVDEAIKTTGVYDVRCTLYGSSLTRLGFKGANVNIDIHYDLEKISNSHPELAENAKFIFYLYTTIKESDKFCDVKDLFHVSVPKFTFIHVESGLQCIVCPHFHPGVKTSWLIKDYIDIDGRVKVLCAAFRHWAMVCGMDDVDGGSLSPYCYTLMVIHFLQQVQPPVLPVIDFRNYQYLPKDVKPTRSRNMVLTDEIGSWKSNNSMSLGTLWLRLFRYYLVEFFFKTLVVNVTQHPPMTKQLRGLNGRRMSMEDPFFSKDNVANSLLSSTVMEYLTSCFEKSYRHYSRCPEPDKGDKIISPDVGTSKKSERKKLKEEKRRSREDEKRRSAESLQNEKGTKKLASESDDVSVTPDGGVDTKEGTKAESGDKVLNEDKTSSKKEEDETPDLIIFPKGEDEFSDSESEHEEETSQNEDDNIGIEFRDNLEDSDADSEVDSSDADADADDNDSDIQIEEEYYENERNVPVQPQASKSKPRQDHNDSSPDKEHKSKDTATVAMQNEGGILQCTKHSSTDEASQSEDHGTQSEDHGKGYDSQYDGDVESQDDVKHVHVEGNETESEGVFSDAVVDADDENDNKTVKLESVSDGDATSNEISANMEKLSVEDHTDEFSVPLKSENIEKIVQGLLNDVVGNVDSQVCMSTPESYTPKEKKDSSDGDKLDDEPNSGDPAVTEPSAEDLAENESKNKEENPTFSFERKFLAPLRRVPLYCKICASDGHRSSECISMGVGTIVELKQLPEYFILMINKVCLKIFHDNKLTEREKQSRTKILQDVERHLRNYHDKNVRLALFGSSVNNFGFQGSNRGRSDMDICMRLKSDELPEGFDPGAEIVKLSKALDKNPNYQKVMYIKSAKVPIVKFTMRESNLEGDISLYNCLALKNSMMLKDYSEIDNRVRVLGYCIKVFAKLCEIGDASRGSLSSYAYILLMFYYLQRCEPPVIPVLQELYDESKKKPISMIEGWDTWYFDEMIKLSIVWPGYNRNKQTVGELWLGFFRFFI